LEVSASFSASQASHICASSSQASAERKCSALARSASCAPDVFVVVLKRHHGEPVSGRAGGATAAYEARWVGRAAGRRAWWEGVPGTPAAGQWREAGSARRGMRGKSGCLGGGASRRAAHLRALSRQPGRGHQLLRHLLQHGWLQALGQAAGGAAAASGRGRKARRFVRSDRHLLRFAVLALRARCRLRRARPAARDGHARGAHTAAACASGGEKGRSAQRRRASSGGQR
jgi:hypothetical protein